MSYRVPRECWSDEDDARLEHADLSHLSDRELLKERCALIVRIGNFTENDTELEQGWLEERLAAVTAERRARGAPSFRNGNARQLGADRAPATRNRTSTTQSHRHA